MSTLNEHDREQTQRLMQMLVQQGMRVEEARMVVDIAINATRKAIDTIDSACDVLHKPELVATATMIALRMLTVNIEAAMQITMISQLFGMSDEEAFSTYVSMTEKAHG